MFIDLDNDEQIIWATLIQKHWPWKQTKIFKFGSVVNWQGKVPSYKVLHLLATVSFMRNWYNSIHSVSKVREDQMREYPGQRSPEYKNVTIIVAAIVITYWWGWLWSPIRSHAGRKMRPAVGSLTCSIKDHPKTCQLPTFLPSVFLLFSK